MSYNNTFVYIHTSPTGKKYVGITSELKPEIRWAKGYGYKDNEEFFNDILKYGWDNFSHEVVASGLTRRESLLMERKLIAQYDTYRNGYNRSLGGEGECLDTYNVESPVDLIDGEGKIVGTWRSMSSAAKENGIDYHEIQRSIDGYYTKKEEHKWVRHGEKASDMRAHSIRSTPVTFIQSPATSTEFQSKSEAYRILKPHCSLGTFLKNLKKVQNTEVSAYGGLWTTKDNVVEIPKPKAKCRNFTKKYSTVYQFDISTGKIVGVYDGVIDASRKTMTDRTSICRSCFDASHSHTAGGYIWSYDKNAKYQKPNNPHNKKVRNIETGEVFCSITDAAKSVGVTKGNISAHLRKRSKSAGGYHWEYV